MSFDLTIQNGDIKIGTDGDFEPIVNEQKLIQDMLKAMFTPTGSHKLHTWYGSPLVDNSIGTAIDANILEIIINNGILYALSNLQTLQSMQEVDGQFLTPSEVLKNIDNVEVFRDEFDPRQMVVIISVSTRTGTKVEESFTINL